MRGEVGCSGGVEGGSLFAVVVAIVVLVGDVGDNGGVIVVEES